MATLNAEIEYQKAHVQDDRRPELVISVIVCLSLAYISVLLRILSRRLIQASLKADDWMIVAELFFTTAYVVCFLIAVHYGTGRHEILLQNPTAYHSATLAFELIYNFAIATIKLSILSLYCRIFFPKRNVRYTLGAIATIVVAYTLTQALLVGLQCIPLDTLWDASVKGRCINFNAAAVALSIVNIVTDVAMLSLPVPLLWGLHLSKTRRVQLICTFLLGTFVCAISIVRVIYVSRISLVDTTWNAADSALWSGLECCIGIVSACLPVLRPCYNFLVNNRIEEAGYDQNGTELGIKSNDISLSSPDQTWSTPAVDGRSLDDGSPFARLGVATNVEAAWKSRRPYDQISQASSTGVIVTTDLTQETHEHL